MKTYSVSYLILGYHFKIITHSMELLEKQIEHISKFCYSTPLLNCGKALPISLTYIEDKNVFEEKHMLFLSHKNYETLRTFEYETHYKLQLDNTLYLLQPPAKYVVEKTSEFDYIIYGNPEINATKYVFRIIREIIVRLQENAGKLFMHGSALNISDKGIAIFGNSGSGKTTLLCKLLSESENGFLSNDRIFLYKSGKVKMDYFPIPIVYKVGTVLHNDALKKGVISSKKYNLPQSFLEGSTSFPIPLTDTKLIFKRVKHIETSNLDLIIFPKINFENSDILNIKDLDKELAFKLIQTVCFTPYDLESLREPWILERNQSNKLLTSYANNLLLKIITECKVISLEYGKEISDKRLLDAISTYL